MGNKKHKLVGIMNLFGLHPSFVFPIFETEKKYYFQNSENSQVIDSFYEIKGDDHINQIRFLSDVDAELVGIQDFYSIGDEPIVGFQLSEDEFFVGDIESFIKFIGSFEFVNDILKEEISDFIVEVRAAKKMTMQKRPTTKNE